MPATKKPAHRNIAVIVGTVSRDPDIRELSDGAVVAELDVKVVGEGAPAVTVPVSLLGGPGPGIGAGAEVIVVGRVRRRFYRAGGATVSRTDVLADAVLPLTPAKRAAAALAAAAQAIEAS
jgi:single-strand DNA-binding protein